MTISAARSTLQVRFQDRGKRGFSLLELLIVVAILLIVATIAIPSFLRSRQAANESTAVAALRTVNTAQVTYLSAANGGVYGDLDDLVTAGLLDNRFGEGNTVGGYAYTTTLAGSNTTYTVAAIPTSTISGRFGYYTEPDAVVRYSSGPGVTVGSQVQ